jgi:hypothetical protein
VKNYATKPKRVCEISLKFQPPNTITTHLHSFKTTRRFPFYSPSFSQLPRLIILFLLKKLVRTSILKIELKIMSEEERDSHDPSPSFKDKEKGGEGKSPLGGQWKVKEKVLMLGGQWKEKEKVLMLVGQWKEKEKVPMLGGQWKEKEKVPMLGGQWKEKEKVPMLVGQWNVPSLVANGR